MNLSCCTSCAWYEINSTANEQGKPTPTQVVFFTNQGARAFNELGNIKKRNALYLQWASNEDDFNVIKNALEGEGLYINKYEGVNRCVEVYGTKEEGNE